MKRKSANKKPENTRARESFNRRYENDLKTASKYLKEHYGIDVIKLQKLSYPFFPRRIKAYANYAKLLCASTGDTLQGIDIEKEVSFIGSLPLLPNLDLLNHFFHITVAIAIYILDAIKDCGCLSEAMMYIPSDQVILNTVDLPADFRYPTYSNDLIRGVMLLIEGRNQSSGAKFSGSDVFYDEQSISHNPLLTEMEIDSEKPTASKIQSMNYKQRLKYLISFIPQKVLINAERKLKEAIDHCAMLLLKEFEYIESERFEQGEEMISLSEEQKTALKAHVVLQFVDRNRYGALDSQTSKKNLLKIDNPYEICFAAFYLLECKGDDYVWLIELSGIIVEMACEMLPWYRLPDFSSQPKIEYLCAPVYSLNAVYYRSWDGTTDDEEDVSLVKDTICKIVYRKEGYVLPQNDLILRKIMFIRKGIFEVSVNLVLLAFTIPIGAAVLLLLYRQKATSVPPALFVLVSLAVLFRKQLHDLETQILKRILRYILIRRVMRTPVIEFHDSIDHIKSREDLVKELDALICLTASQKEDLIRYKSLLHDAEKEREHQKAQYDSLKARFETDSRELAELRETIYHSQNSTELEADTQSIETRFPYSQKRKTIIIGGHEKWISAMKQYIPNAMYIDPSSLNFDVALIRNADVLWLQTNAMPHSLYYKIINKARRGNIQIKYFSFSSAQKCALQIFLFDNND